MQHFKPLARDREAFHFLDRSLDAFEHMQEGREDRLVWNDIDFGKEYFRGRIGVALHINTKAFGGSENRSAFCQSVKRAGGNSLFGCQVNQKKAVHVADVGGGQDGPMLVNAIERVHGIEQFPITRRVCRKADKQFFDRLRGCYHSARRGFEI